MKQNLFWILCVLFMCVSCGDGDKGSYNFKTIDNIEQILELIATDDIVIIDVRTTDEFAKGHLKNATNMDVVNNNNFVSDISMLDKNATYFVYCARGTRSQMACSIMSSLGFKHVYNSAPGYEAISEMRAN